MLMVVPGGGKKPSIDYIISEAILDSVGVPSPLAYGLSFLTPFFTKTEAPLKPFTSLVLFFF
jgi:hypothetical protein